MSLRWGLLCNEDQAARRYLYESLVSTILTLRFCQGKVRFEKGQHLGDLCVWRSSYFKPFWRSGNVKDFLKRRSCGMLTFKARLDHCCRNLELHLNAPYSKKWGDTCFILDVFSASTDQIHLANHKATHFRCSAGVCPLSTIRLWRRISCSVQNHLFAAFLTIVSSKEQNSKNRNTRRGIWATPFYY